MIRKLLPTVAAAVILLLGACSTNKLAQQSDQVDDAYYTEARAREYEKRSQAQAEEKRSDRDYVTDDELYGDYNDDYYDRRDYYDDYSARINRFRNYSPWRGYYDYRYNPYYGYNSWDRYNNFYGSSFGIHIGIGNYYGHNYYNPWNRYYNPWNYYGSQYYGNYWGPYSYYNVYNPYSYGNYGNYYGNTGRPIVVNPNYRTRPNRETENLRRGAYPSNTGDRVGSTPSRPERISTSSDRNSTIDQSSQPARSSRPSRGDVNRGSVERSGERPAVQKTERTESSRPQRSESPRIESRPAERQQSTPPPSSPPQRSSDNNNNSSRPSRSGGR